MPRRAAAALVFLLCAGPGVQAGWQDEVRALEPGVFPPPPDLRATYAFGWGGVEAARTDVVLRKEDGRWQGELRGGTTGLARRLWKLDAEYRAEIEEDGWRTVWMEGTESYANYRVTAKADFAGGVVRLWRESTKAGAKPPKWRTFSWPGLRDLAAALLLARSQPLHDGQRLTLAVFPGEWTYLVRVKVERHEEIAWQGARRKAIRATLAIDSIEKDGSLKPHRKFQRGTVWVSDDEVRLPLRIEVKVFIGSVFAEMVSLQPGT